MNTRSTPPTLAALAMVAVIAAGCSSAPAESGETGTAGSARTKNTSIRDKGVKFAECMRDKGVRDFPDPDASGRLTIDGVLNGSSLDPSSPAWKHAMSACKELEPPGFTGDRDVSPEQQDARLAFARCIREHGVKDFPDPAKGDPLVDTRRIPSSAAPGGMTILNAAMRKCGALAARAGVVGSRP